jgi:hypothetical protein
MQMALVVQNTVTRIDQDWLDKNKNEKAGQPLYTTYSDYAAKAIGAFRSLQVVRGVCKLWNGTNIAPSPVVKNLEDGAGAAMTGLGIVRIPSATQDAIGRVVDLTKNDGVALDRKVALLVKDGSDALTTWIYSASYLTGASTFLGVARVADLAGDGADFGLSVDDYSKAVDCEAAASGDVKAAFTHSKNYYMLRIAKAVTSVVSAILALIFFVTGAQIVSVTALIVLSLVSALLAIRRDMYKEEGQFRVIGFDRTVIV